MAELRQRVGNLIVERDAAFATRNHEKQRADRVTAERDALNAKVFTVNGEDVIAARDATIARLQSKCDKQSAEIHRWTKSTLHENERRKQAETQRDWLYGRATLTVMCVFRETFPGFMWNALTKQLRPFPAEAAAKPAYEAKQVIPPPAEPLKTPVVVNSAADIAALRFINADDSLGVRHATMQLQGFVTDLYKRVRALEAAVSAVGK